jgi:hypothetical protein
LPADVDELDFQAEAAGEGAVVAVHSVKAEIGSRFSPFAAAPVLYEA